MVGKFLNLQEAASQIGVTPEQLMEMRTRGEIYGYRDGSSWKFKVEEVEHYINERGPGGSAIIANDDEFDLLKLAGSSGGASGSVAPAGAEGKKQPSAELNLDEYKLADSHGAAGESLGMGSMAGDSLAGESVGMGSLAGESIGGDSIGMDSLGEESIGAEGDSVLLTEDVLGGSAVNKKSTVIGKEGSKSITADSDLRLVDEARPTGGSGVISTPEPKSGSDVLNDADDLKKSGSGTGVMKGSDAAKGENVELDIGNAFGGGVGGMSDASISMDASIAGMSSFGGSLGGSISDSSEIELDAGVLNKSASESDVTLGGAAESGINLASPADSGLSLEEEPLDLGGSLAGDLPEDSDGDISVEEDAIPIPPMAKSAPPRPAVAKRRDEAFNLSPSQGGAEEEPDSGSQVIALEDSASFEDAAASLGARSDGLVADEGMFAGDSMAGMYAAGGMGAMMIPVEKPHTLFDIGALLVTCTFLALSGMLMWDVVQNMWAFGEKETLSSGLMDSIVSAFWGNNN